MKTEHRKIVEEVLAKDQEYIFICMTDREPVSDSTERIKTSIIIHMQSPDTQEVISLLNAVRTVEQKIFETFLAIEFGHEDGGTKEK